MYCILNPEVNTQNVYLTNYPTLYPPEQNNNYSNANNIVKCDYSSIMWLKNTDRKLFCFLMKQKTWITI